MHLPASKGKVRQTNPFWLTGQRKREDRFLWENSSIWTGKLLFNFICLPHLFPTLPYKGNHLVTNLLLSTEARKPVVSVTKFLLKWRPCTTAQQLWLANSGLPEGLCCSSSPSLSCSWTSKTSTLAEVGWGEAAAQRHQNSSTSKTKVPYHSSISPWTDTPPPARHLCAFWGSFIQQQLPALPLKLLVQLP